MTPAFALAAVVLSTTIQHPRHVPTFLAGQALIHLSPACIDETQGPVDDAQPSPPAARRSIGQIDLYLHPDEVSDLATTLGLSEEQRLFIAESAERCGG